MISATARLLVIREAHVTLVVGQAMDGKRPPSNIKQPPRFYQSHWSFFSSDLNHLRWTFSKYVLLKPISFALARLLWAASISDGFTAHCQPRETTAYTQS